MKWMQKFGVILSILPCFSLAYVDQTVYPAGYSGYVDQTVYPAGYYPPTDGERIITGTYLTGAAGYASINWQDSANPLFFNYSSNAGGGTAYGFAVGYRYRTWLALEGGWYKLPTVQGLGFANIFTPPLLANISLASWFGYIWAKFLINIVHYFYLDISLGGAFRSFQLIPQQYFLNANPGYYSLTAGLGFQWDMTQNSMLFFKYFFIPSNPGFAVQSRNCISAPSVNLFVVGLGYKFSV